MSRVRTRITRRSSGDPRLSLTRDNINNNNNNISISPPRQRRSSFTPQHQRPGPHQCQQQPQPTATAPPTSLSGGRHPATAARATAATAPTAVWSVRGAGGAADTPGVCLRLTVIRHNSSNNSISRHSSHSSMPCINNNRDNESSKC